MQVGINPLTAMADRERSLVDVVRRESGRLAGFVRGRVRDPGDAEDIVQDVLAEFVAAYRLPEPIEQAGAWLLRVARNRIVDRFRKARELPLAEIDPDDDESPWLERALPDRGGGPDAAYARRRMLEAVEQALAELPAEQRDVFIAHELDGVIFNELARRSGVPLSTLLARKHYAVLHLRRRLQGFHDDLERS